MGNLDFSDLGEDLSGEIVKPPAPAANDGLMGQTKSEIAGAMFESKCPVQQCYNGSWVAYTGRVVGPCRKCHGTGILRTKTNPEVLKKNREDSKAKKVLAAKENIKAAVKFLADNPALDAWFLKKVPSFDFAKSLYDSLIKYGSLTENQLATVEKMIAKDSKWEADRNEASHVADLDMTGLVEIFANASQHLKSPRLHIDDLVFTKAPSTGKNAGYLYAKFQDEYAGKISPDGSFMKAWGCSEETVNKIKAISKDPMAAAQAHGHDTGNCSACGRLLTNELSVQIGIGPICRGRWGI